MCVAAVAARGARPRGRGHPEALGRLRDGPGAVDHRPLDHRQTGGRHAARGGQPLHARPVRRRPNAARLARRECRRPRPRRPPRRSRRSSRRTGLLDRRLVVERGTVRLCPPADEPHAPSRRGGCLEPGAPGRATGRLEVRRVIVPGQEAEHAPEPPAREPSWHSRCARAALRQRLAPRSRHDASRWRGTLLPRIDAPSPRRGRGDRIRRLAARTRSDAPREGEEPPAGRKLPPPSEERERAAALPEPRSGAARCAPARRAGCTTEPPVHSLAERPRESPARRRAAGLPARAATIAGPCPNAVAST